MAGDPVGRRMRIGTMPSLKEDSLGGGPARFRDIKAMAQAAEALGFDSFWLADHLIFRDPDGRWVGTWEGLTFLSAVAAVTTRIALGPLVACTSFRNPALLAKMADSLDELADGRFILGLGCGWNEPEYAMFDYPFDHRVSRFAEALAIIAPLLKEGRADFRGAYHRADAAILAPRGPSPTGPPLMIGGVKPRMLRLVARHADLYNTDTVTSVGRVRELAGLLRRACEEEGRDPATLPLTSFTSVRVLGPGERAADFRPGENAIVGEPGVVASALAEFADSGVTHLILRFEQQGMPGIERFAPVLELLDSAG